MPASCWFSLLRRASNIRSSSATTAVGSHTSATALASESCIAAEMNDAGDECDTEHSYDAPSSLRVAADRPSR